jgi:hypothetical protein
VFEVKLMPHPHLALMIRPSCCYVRNIHHIACYLVPSLDDGDSSDNDGMLMVRCYRLTDFDIYGTEYTSATGGILG